MSEQRPPSKWTDPEWRRLEVELYVLLEADARASLASAQAELDYCQVQLDIVNVGHQLERARTAMFSAPYPESFTRRSAYVRALDADRRRRAAVTGFEERLRELHNHVGRLLERRNAEARYPAIQRAREKLVHRERAVDLLVEAWHEQRREAAADE